MHMEDEIRERWITEQAALKARLVTEDERLSFELSDLDGGTLKYIGGVDISFVKNNSVDACAALVVLEYPSLEVVFEKYKMVELTLPYISTFLAFREVPFLVQLFEELKRERPELVPQVIFVDGNGFLHPRGFGLACHFGVLADVPTIGIGKPMLLVDGVGSAEIKALAQEHCCAGGDAVELVGESGTVWGAAFRSTDESSKPIFVSLGHRLSLSTALELTRRVCRYRIPEPVRAADLGSRDHLRQLELAT